MKKRASEKAAEENFDFSDTHWNLESYVKETRNDPAEILLDYKVYHNNLMKYKEIVPGHMRTRPVYKLLCFLLND